MTDRAATARQILGWAAVSISALVAGFWAFWGINENFHEGWFSASVWSNLALMLAQYLSPLLAVLALSMAAFRWPRVALPLTAACAVGSAWFFRGAPAAILLITVPLLVLGGCYHFGRPEPRRWAWRLLVGIPLLTLIGFGAYPGWLAMHRFDDGNYGMRRVAGNGVTLVWAPQGPGWPDRGTTWQQAQRRCAHLSDDGVSLGDQPRNLWRLPTVDEAVRSLVFRGQNAGGAWDPALHRARYRVNPDKDSPLWKVHSPVIYWWTATEIDRDRAYYITSNGYVLSFDKKLAPGDLGFRCVREPAGMTP